MFYSVKGKFYTIAILLIISFSIGYGILAYFIHQQNQSALLAGEVALFQKDISKLNNLFYEARFWEKTILLQNNPDAEMQFGAIIEEIKKFLGALREKEFSETAKSNLTQVVASIDKYETDFNRLIQLKVKQSLLHTRMETNYQSMVSIILHSNKPSLLKPLFNLTHFLTAYRSSRDTSKYQALKLVIGSIEKKTGYSDIRMSGYLQNFITLLDEDYLLENQILSIDKDVSKINAQLKNHFTNISLESEAFLERKYKETSDIRRELKLILFLAAILGAILLIVILFLISRNIVNPIRSMAIVMQDVKAGDLTARFQPQSGRNDEIIQFGLSFNEMLLTLEANNRKLVNYQTELEEKIQELSERETESRRLTAQLQRAQKMEAIGTLAGGVAHDLNNVLSGLVSYPELLLLDLPDDSPYRKTILTIQESGHKAAAIVQDLLALARRGVAVTETINLNKIVNDYLSSPEYKDLIKSPNNEIEIRVSMDADLFNIKGSPLHLTKTIMNLASNAVESIADKGVIQVRTQNRYIDGPIRGYDDVEEGDYAVLTIEDSGSGISDSDLEHIFEPFFTQKSMGRSGTGLGMAVVWNTVKDHKGYIDVRSAEGNGTVFRLYFPATRNKLAEETVSLSFDGLMGNGEFLLIVDDVVEQRQITAELLEKLGYSVGTLASGEEAVEYLKQNKVELLILDMIMEPGMNGLETYKKILETTPDQKAIIASGYSEDKHVKEAQRLGAGEYIKKPFSLETLGIAVKKALEK